MLNMALHKKLEIFHKRKINYEFLKCPKLKKTKQRKSRPINQIFNSLFAETSIKIHKKDLQSFIAFRRRFNFFFIFQPKDQRKYMFMFRQ